MLARLNFCSAALLLRIHFHTCRLNTNRTVVFVEAQVWKISFKPTRSYFAETFVLEFYCSKMVPPALKRLLRGICISSGYRQNLLQANELNSQVCLRKILDLRVAEVGRLSANAKNAFNSFVGCVFASLRQKTLFLPNYQNCNKSLDERTLSLVWWKNSQLVQLD